MSNYPLGAAGDSRAPFNKMEFGMKVCPICDGMQEMDEQPCSECLGEGEIPMDAQDYEDMKESYQEDFKD